VSSYFKSKYWSSHAFTICAVDVFLSLFLYPTLTTQPQCSLFVLIMPVQTLGDAWKLGWRITARCIWGVEDPHSRSKRRTIECDTTAELDLKTLV